MQALPRVRATNFSAEMKIEYTLHLPHKILPDSPRLAKARTGNPSFAIEPFSPIMKYVLVSGGMSVT